MPSRRSFKQKPRRGPFGGVVIFNREVRSTTTSLPGRSTPTAETSGSFDAGCSDVKHGYEPMTDGDERQCSSLCAELERQRIAHRVEIEPVGLDQRRGLDDDVVDVADLLEALVEVGAVEPHALAEQLHKIHHLEAAAVARVADLAVAGMVDRRQGRYPG